MMVFTNQWHRDRKNQSWYVKVGSGKFFESDALEFWALMVGEDSIKDFLKKCEKDEWGNYIPVLKENK